MELSIGLAITADIIQSDATTTPTQVIGSPIGLLLALTYATSG